MTLLAEDVDLLDLPGTLDSDISILGSMTLDVDELDEGYRRVSFSVQLDDIAGEMVAGDERIDLSDPSLAAEFASIPLTFDIVIDERGAAVDMSVQADGESVDLAPLLEAIGGDASGFLGGMGNETLFGIPEFPEDEIQVGTSWTFDASREVFGVLLEQSTTYVVEAIEGDLITIDVETRVGAFSMSSDLFTELLLSIPEESRSEMFGAPLTDQEIEQAFGEFDFNLDAAPSTAVGTVVFDASRGVTTASATSMEQSMSIDLSVPDEMSGELVEVTMDIDQSVTVELSLDQPGA